MAAGDILSCEVLATGWQAKVIIDDFKDGGTYDFGDIDADVANAKFTMTVVSEGYNTSGTLGTITRTVYGTRVCQKAYPNQATAEETEAAGDVALTIALSDYVYDDDNTGAGKSGTAPTVTIGAGWYTDNGAGGSSAANNAATNLAVTNSSTQDYPTVAGARWATVPYQRFTSTFDIEMVAFHHHAKDGKPLACVKFNDGTTDTYVTAMAKSAQADSLPCYVHTLDATDYTDNTNVTLNFTCYPWVGDADSTVTSVGGSVNALTLGPLQLYADSDNDAPVYYVVVDTAGNDGTAVASTTYATAAASPALSVRKAVDLISTANGGNADFGRILLNAGSHSTAGAGNGACTNGWVTVEPNTNTSATKATAKLTGAPGAYVRGWLKFQGITIEPTGYMYGGTAGRYLWIDDCAVNRATYSTTQPFGEYPHIYITHSTSDKVNAFGPNGTGNVGALIRGCSANDTTGLTGSGYGPRVVVTTTLNGLDTRACKLVDISASNTVIAYNRVFGDADTGNSCVTGAGAYDDCAIICNIIERTAGTQVAVSIWSDSNTTSNKNILIWHNTIAGERANVGYNEGTSAVTRTHYSVKYNSFEEFDTKHDVFKTDGTRTGAWSVTYGIGAIGNHADNELFPPYEYGIRGTSNAASGYVDDQSVIGGGAGGGDYTPDAGSVLIDKIASAADVVIPWDINGLAYAAGGCAGAITLSGSLSTTSTTATSTWTAPASTASPGALTATSTVATADWSTPASTASAGAVSASSTTATATWTAPASTAAAGSVSASSTTATADWATPASTATPGSVTATATVTTASWVTPASTATGVGGAVSTPAVTTWVAPAATAAPGAVTATSTAATTSWVAPASTAVGGNTVTSTAASLTWVTPASTATLGGATVTSTSATATWTTPASTATPGSVTAVSVAALLSWVTPASTVGDGLHYLPVRRTARVSRVPFASVSARPKGRPS
jgi:hypothetical protein